MPRWSPATGGRQQAWPAAWFAFLALVLLTVALGLLRLGPVRPLYVAGAAAVGWLAWRESAARSVEMTILLFSITPFLRRIVDQGAGYDPGGMMLLGPMVAILLPATELLEVLVRPVRADRDLAPHLLVFCCVGYGLALSAFSGELVDGATSALKLLAPLAYGAWILRRAREDDAILTAVVRAFLVATPAMGAYAIFQYINPPDWDRYWMVSSQMLSVGLPEPYKLRAFSTMNAPAAFAVYSAYGLLFIGFSRRGLTAILLALPTSVGLLLSLYRTAWIAFAIGVLYCALFARHRGRAVLLAAAVATAGMLALSTTEMGDVIAQRLATFGSSVSEDSSGQERLQQFIAFYDDSEQHLFGQGLAMLRIPFHGIAAVDGDVIAALLTMGLVVGSVFLVGVIWAAVQALSRIRSRDPTERLVAGAVVAGSIVQLPLSGITGGELGVQFWLFVALATSRPRPAIETPGGCDQRAATANRALRRA